MVCVEYLHWVVVGLLLSMKSPQYVPSESWDSGVVDLDLRLSLGDV